MTQLLQSGNNREWQEHPQGNTQRIIFLLFKNAFTSTCLPARMTVTQPSPELPSLGFKALKKYHLVIHSGWDLEICRGFQKLFLLVSLRGLGASVPARAHTSSVMPKGSLEERGAAHRDITAGEGGRRWGGYNPMVT